MEPANILMYDALIELKRKAQKDPNGAHFTNLLIDSTKHERLAELIEAGYLDFLEDEDILEKSMYAYQTRVDNGILVVIACYSPPRKFNIFT